MDTTTEHVSTLQSASAPSRNSESRSASAESSSETSSSAAPAKPKSASAKSNTPPPRQIAPRGKVDVNLRTLLEAGVHFGHQTSRWDPSMSQYIYTTRNGIHIIHLPKTVQNWTRARQAIVEIIGNGGQILFVGTKKQAQEAIVEEAMRCGAFYVSRRWLGGMLTNFQTIRKSIERMRKVESILQEEEQLQASGQPAKFTKKERLMMSRELEKLEFSLGGIKDMHAPPQVLFVADIKREEIAIKEARRMDIPVVALVDTNCNPANVVYPIPSNDDGTRAIRLFCQAVADAVADGRKIAGERAKEIKDKKEKERQAQAKAREKAAAEKANEEKAAAESEAKRASEGAFEAEGGVSE